MANTELVGMKELMKMFGDLEKLPQKCVNKSSKQGANIALKSARNKSPFFTGELEGGIVLVPEKTKTKGKKVYQITFDKSKNSVFQKKNKEGKVIGYYPASLEYGWIMKNGQKHEGLHFMRDSVQSNASSIEKTILDEFISNIEKVTK